MLAAVAIGDHRDDALPFDADAEFAEADNITDAQVQQLNRWLNHESDPQDGDEDFYWDRSGPERWACDAYRATAGHITNIAGWVHDADDDLAALAAALLAWFPPTPRSVAVLVAVANGPVRASANLALAHLPTCDPHVDQRLRRLLTIADQQVALTAAIALAYRHGQSTPEPALTLLAAAADHAQSLPPDVPGWDDRALRGFVAMALNRIGW